MAACYLQQPTDLHPKRTCYELLVTKPLKPVPRPRQSNFVYFETGSRRCTNPLRAFPRSGECSRLSNTGSTSWMLPIDASVRRTGQGETFAWKKPGASEHRKRDDEVTPAPAKVCRRTQEEQEGQNCQTRSKNKPVTITTVHFAGRIHTFNNWLSFFTME